MSQNIDQPCVESGTACGSATSSESIPICVWRFFDGKAGHRNQVAGLTEAIGRRENIVCRDIDASSLLRGVRSLIPGRLDSLQTLPLPTLLIGAGHSTHLPMLAARKKFGGQAIVLMKPTLPRWLFDLCLIPKADGIKSIAENVILTEGALNRVQPSQRQDKSRGLILIGGPSEHFGWRDCDVIAQVREVTEKTPQMEWTLTTSRRTPVSFLDSWSDSGCRGRMVPVDQTDAGWLPAQLQSAGTVWVTNESVSMIYEALTSGAAVGILTLPKSRQTRVTNGIDALISQNLVTPFDQWKQTSTIAQASRLFDEAGRCADLIVARFLTKPQPLESSLRRVA